MSLVLAEDALRTVLNVGLHHSCRLHRGGCNPILFGGAAVRACEERRREGTALRSDALHFLPLFCRVSPSFSLICSLPCSMKRKLDPEVRTFPSGKKPCKGPEYSSPTGIVPCPATPTTFGHIRTANGQGQQRRRITSIQPPTGLQEWLRTFQSWTGPEKLLALDELIDSCEPTQVKHMMQVIEPQFQRDFISLLPKELALYVLSFLEPKDLLQAAQTCRYWRILAEDNLLWREKCKEEGIDEPLPLKKRKIVKPGFTHSPWKSAYIRQHRIDTNWRRGDLKSPKVLKGHDDHVITCLQFCGNRIVSGSDDNTLKCLRTLVGHTGGVWSSQMRDNIIISGSTDRTLKVWNAETGECIHTLYGHTSTVRCMHLHEKRVVSGSRDATLRVWDIETGQCLHVLMGHVAAVRCVQYDGRRVVSGAYDFMVKVWDPETETCLHTLQGHTNRVYSLQCTLVGAIAREFDGIHVVSGSLDTSIRVWDVETGNCIHTLTGHQSLTSGMELKDNILVSGNADSTVKIWDIKTGQCLQTLQAQDDGTVKLWDLKTGEFIRNLVTLESGGSGGVVWRIRASNTKLVCAVGSRNGTEETKLLVLDFDVDMKSPELFTQTRKIYNHHQQWAVLSSTINLPCPPLGKCYRQSHRPSRVQPLLSTPYHQYEVESEGIGLETRQERGEGGGATTSLSLLDWLGEGRAEERNDD
ncbi:F-box/WD repeat-containing protein 7 [Collichthys lucidus]|uniref:F-box/WD repeat-containing protein 7 n=1 Tax=Collichthys lucidus TaxID=240159 RepID=A0A4U5U2P8_COLLU|nr:F-box/WD repeat-containing protein 7 [Collichthys lucidus]